MVGKIDDIKGLISFLSNCVTEERWHKFKNIIDERTRHITVVIEDVYQPHNISAVLRSCECFGIQDVHIIDKNDYFEINTDIELGASKWLNIELYNKKRGNNTKACLKKLKKNGYKLIATTPHSNDCKLEELNIDNKTALIFGKELEGLSDDAKDMADGFMKIPMFGFTESLNISVTVALCLHYLTKKLRELSINIELSEAEKDIILLDWLKASVKNSDMIINRYYSENQKNG